MRRILLIAMAALPLAGQQLPLQPLAQQVRRLEDALSFMGQPLPASTLRQIDDAIAGTDEAAAVAKIQAALDPLVLAIVEINPESRVKVARGAAKAELVEGGSRCFLVKVLNNARVTAPLNVASPNSAPVFEKFAWRPTGTKPITVADVRDRWADFAVYRNPPMAKTLSGLELEYQILEVSSRDRGARSANVSFDVGQGSQDIGFRNDIQVLFQAIPAKQIRLHVKDEKGAPTMASFTVRDQRGRLYPNPSRRLAPDLFFQPQIYRADGEFLNLPYGYYTIAVTGGPEYNAHTKEFAVDAASPAEFGVQLDRWIDPSKFGWYSGDSHVHAAGCSHYAKPEEGVKPEDMMRQITGEKLNIASVLTWGPGYYYQKQFFSGHDDPLSKPNELMHYDVEVSGFPSSDNGHLVLLQLKDQDYPGTKKIEDWPSWDMPILQWGKKQGAATGFTHSGWGLLVADKTIPSFQMPAFDGIGANEFIVDVTHPDTIDFLSIGDTPPVSELSIWYHTLNVGFRTRIAGETDFPCITDDRVGLSRSYVKVDGPLTYEKWVRGVQDGRSYTSDGRAHLMDFAVNGTLAGTNGSEVRLQHSGKVHITLRTAALLDSQPHPELQNRPAGEKPYWTIERARLGDSNEVPVELVVNGKVMETKKIAADGSVRELSFDAAIEQSSWVAVRVLPAAHTNPVFVMVGGRPIRSQASADWCLRAVRQCWTQKAPLIRAGERAAARAAYDHAEQVYSGLMR